MNNVAFRFGPSNVLVGVGHLPVNPTRDRKVGVLILNAGVIHRVGPNRLHTSLAMRLASHGFTVLRFDFSGVGDSSCNPTDVGLPQRNIDETRAAMDLLGSNYGIEQFILIGLCSGADNAFRAATADSRVVGLALLDGYAYHTQQSLRKNLVSVSGLAKTVSDLSTSWKLRANASERAQVGLMLTPPKIAADHELSCLVERGVRILLVYTPEFGIYNYTDQCFDFFPTIDSHPAVRVEFFEDADHIFTEKQHQVALTDLMAAWAMETSHD